MPRPAPRPIRRGIVFERVGFTYPGRTTPVLQVVSFCIRRGECVALVGHNGAGKVRGESWTPRGHVVRFEGVRFRYAGRADAALAGLDLKIRAGHSLAIVGDNGAGKTTLVKLLARLYDPDEALITLLELCDGRGAPI